MCTSSVVSVSACVPCTSVRFFHCQSCGNIANDWIRLGEGRGRFTTDGVRWCLSPHGSKYFGALLPSSVSIESFLHLKWACVERRGRKKRGWGVGGGGGGGRVITASRSDQHGVSPSQPVRSTWCLTSSQYNVIQPAGQINMVSHPANRSDQHGVSPHHSTMSPSQPVRSTWCLTLSQYNVIQPAGQINMVSHLITVQRHPASRSDQHGVSPHHSTMTSSQPVRSIWCLTSSQYNDIQPAGQINMVSHLITVQ